MVMMKMRLALTVVYLCLLPGCARPGPPPCGKTALKHAKQQVSFGPRYPGSEAAKEARAYFKRHLPTAQVEEQSFTAVTPAGLVRMVNLIAVYPGKSEDMIILASHYDTKHLAIGDWDSANDGPSSSGLLLELARAVAARRNLYTTYIVFFDGEECYQRWGPRDGTFGSRYLASRMAEDGRLGRVKAMILVDLVGDAELNICLDPRSTPELTELARRSADALGYGAYFFAYECRSLEDDHTPFLARGVPAIDLIDFDYGPGNAYWHTKQDTVDKLSADSLQVVGDVVMKMIRELETESRRNGETANGS